MDKLDEISRIQMRAMLKDFDHAMDKAEEYNALAKHWVDEATKIRDEINELLDHFDIQIPGVNA